MLTLRPTVTTERDFQNRIEVIRSLARPHPELVQVVQRAILQAYAENFASESAGGTRWAALAASTILDRLAQGYGAGPILQRTGNYRSSWVNDGDGNHVHEIEQRAGGWTLSEGSSHHLADFHEQGNSGMPARPVAELSPSAKEQLGRAVDNWILNHLLQR
jgi:hypothetical protein